MRAPDPFHTEEPINKTTYETIAARLLHLDSPIRVEEHIAQSTRKGKTQYSTLEAKNSTLDGISFIAHNPPRLASQLDGAKDKWGHRALASMKEDPGHWGLKASFGKTVGTGWREIWRADPYRPTTVLKEPGHVDSMMSMRFGNAGSPLSFTALHCALDKANGQCNIHIDEAGFVLGLPEGVALTPDFYGHLMNELLLKTEFRNWLSGLMPNKTAADAVKEAFRRISLNFPSAANRYAGLTQTVNGMHYPRGLSNGLFTAARLLAPVGATVDLYEGDRYKVQATGTILNGNSSITITLGGEW